MKKIFKDGGILSGNFPRQLFLIMKLTLFILITSVLSSLATGSYSQNARVTLDLKSVTVKETLKAIESSSEFFFVYNNELINVDRKIDIQVKNEKIGDVLNKIFDGRNVEVTVIDRKIILAPTYMGSQQQGNKVTGKVTDSSSGSLPGVSVVVKGTTTGVITDMNGNYSLGNIPENATLQFSFVGMKTQEIAVGNKTTINVTLAEETVGIEEVVAVGYGVQKKINLTGAVANVNQEQLVKRPVSNIGLMMQGFVPGVKITQNSGEPGNEGLDIMIRGRGTFSSAGSNPLVIIDGIQGSLSNLNPNDVESISILKDAASASIYGVQGANGVILVTTKKGVKGKVKVEYNGTYAINSPTKLFDLVTTSSEYMQLSNEAKINSGISTGLYSDAIISAYQNATDRSLYPNTNWLDLMFKPSPTQLHHVSFSGGEAKTQYYLSFGFVDSKGVMKGYDYNKLNIDAKISSQLNDKIRFGAKFSLGKDNKVNPHHTAEVMFANAMAQPPTYSPMLADGSGRYSFKAYDFEYNLTNPIAEIDNKVNSSTVNYSLYSLGWLDIDIAKNFSWSTKVAMNLNFKKYQDFRAQIPLYNFRTNDYMSLLDVGGSGLVVQDEQTAYKNIHSYVTYNNTIGTYHKIDAMLGASMEDNEYQYLYGYRKVFSSNILRQLDAGSPSVQQASGNQTEWALMSIFSRVRYNFKDKYLLEANMRYDGTSRLPKSSRWGSFPSFSAGWRVSEENFIKNLNWNWLSSMKLRGSFGVLGNQNIGLYPFQSILSIKGNYSYDDSSLSTGVAQTQLSNENIKWETTSILDYGVDLNVFDGLNVVFDWYKRRTSDILRSSQLTQVVGLEPPTVNNGTIENTGAELGIQYVNKIKNVRSKDLNYSIGFNIDKNINKLVDFGSKEINNYFIREEGKEWDAFYMLEWIGIFQSNEEIANSPKQFNDATVPGDLKYLDANNDGKIDNNDRIAIKGRYPNLNYGFNFSSNWKGFDLSIQAQGVNGVKYFVNSWGTIPFVQGAPPTTNWRERWTETNHSSTMPRIYWGNSAPQRLSRNSSWFLQDASYLRLKNVTFGYNFSNGIIKKLGLESLRLYFSGDNLLTITKYPGLDPERVSSGSLVNYPQNKIFSFGVNVKL